MLDHNKFCVKIKEHGDYIKKLNLSKKFCTVCQNSCYSMESLKKFRKGV